MRSVPTTKFQMTCVTSMDIVTPKTRLSKAHTGYGTHFLPLASQVLRGPGSLPQVALFPSHGVLSAVHTLHAHSRFACVSSAPKGPLVSLTTVQVPSILQGSGHKWSLWDPQSGDICSRTEGRRKGGEGRCLRTGTREIPLLFSCGKPQIKLGCEVRPPLMSLCT